MNASQKASQPWLENKVIISALLILILNGSITFKLQETNLHTLFLLLNCLKVKITSPAYLMKKKKKTLVEKRIKVNLRDI